MKSNYKKINLKDVAKGFILAFITTLVATAINIINIFTKTGNFDLSWQSIKIGLYAAAVAGLSYIIKNYFTNSKDKFAKPEPSNDRNRPVL